MPGKFHHEQLYRGVPSLVRFSDVRLTLCGAGALGSHLADNFTRQGFGSLRLVDRDRVEEHNIGTQIYGAGDIGAHKVEVLRNRIFRATGIEVEAIAKEVNERNIRALLKGADVVVDAFDNSASRQLVQDYCRAEQVACVHVGLSADYAEVIWDEYYRVPGEVLGDVCDYPLARNLVLLAVAVASETLVRYVLHGARHNWSMTMHDFAVRPLELAQV